MCVADVSHSLWMGAISLDMICAGGGGGILFGFILVNMVEIEIPVYMKSMVRGPTLGF